MLQRCLGACYFSLEVVDLDVCTLDSIVDERTFTFIMAFSNLLPFHLLCKVFGVTLFARHLMLKILAVLDLASCISSFSSFLASIRVS